MKLHEIFTHEDPIVLELVKKRLDSGEIVIIRWTENGREHEADVHHIRHAASGDGYAIEYTQSDKDGHLTGDKIFFRAPELENAGLTKDGAMWTLDLRKDKK